MDSNPQCIAQALHEAAIESDFNGVIRLDAAGVILHSQGYGLADRIYGLPNTAEHRFGVASISKGFTAVVIGSLIDQETLGFDTTAHSILGDDLPLIDPAATVGQLLSHTAGVGDYLDESVGEITDHVLNVPVHTLAETSGFLPMLRDQAQTSKPGSQFSYNNAGFVILALIAERITSTGFHDLVRQRVFEPAGMDRSDYPRMDELGADVSRAYLSRTGPRTNIWHLPARGSGDGGAVTTTADLASFWRAVAAGRLLSKGTLESLVEPVSTVDDEQLRYGRGFWRGWDSELIILEGYDAGVSGRSWYDPRFDLSASVLANSTDDAWPVLNAISWEAG